MKIPVLFIITILTINFVFSQEVENKEYLSKNSQDSCKCIDNYFSSSKLNPIAYSKIGDHKVAFCGLTGGVYEMDTSAIQTNNSGFKRTGYEIILCSKDSSIFYESEYYTDSIVILKNSFKLYRISDFPTNKGLQYESIPLLEFHFTSEDNNIIIDTTLAIPSYLLESEFLNELEKLVETYKLDNIDLSKYYDLNLHFLFLRAVSNSKYKEDFISSGPYDGYMGPIFRDFKSYLNLKNK